MAESWVVALKSRDRVVGTSASAYTVTVPPDLPKRPYKCTVRIVVGSLTANAAYSLLMRSPAITRCLSNSSANYGFVTACTFNGQQQAEPGVVYFSTAPDRIDMTFEAIATEALPVVDEHVILLHFEPVDCSLCN